MAGRPKIKMYEYTSEGYFVREYNSIQEVFNKYYEGKKRPLIYKDNKYAYLPNGNLICTSRLGRDNILKIKRIKASIYVPNAKENRRKIVVYNLASEPIATFRSAHIASVLTGIDRATIDSSIKASPKRTKKYSKTTELVFKYENDIVSL